MEVILLTTAFMFMILVFTIIAFFGFIATIISKFYKEYIASRSNERMIVSGAVMLLKGIEGVNRDIYGPSKTS